MSDKSLVRIIEDEMFNENMKLPVFNRVAMQLLDIIQKDDYNGDHLAEVAQQDQALVTQILKVANSAFYAGLNPVKTVKDAALRIGAKSLTNIAQLVTQKQMYKAKNKSINNWMNMLWSHALGTAIASKWLAENLGYNTLSDEAFMGGLLHDIGKLIQLRIIDNLLTDKKVRGKISANLVKEILEDLHPAHGKLYLEKQCMPVSYGEIAARHHEAEIAGDNFILNVVRLSNLTCHRLGVGIKKKPSLILSTTPEAISLMARDIVLAELQVSLEEQIRSMDASV